VIVDDKEKLVGLISMRARHSQSAKPEFAPRPGTGSPVDM